MLQPFEILKSSYVHRLESMNKNIFVVQGYHRCREHAVIVSVYDDIGLAKTHFNAVKEDEDAEIIDIRNAEEKSHLLEMINGTACIVYWAVVRDATALERTVNANFKENMRKYIASHTNWHVSAAATLRPSIQLIFGELYINLKYRNELIRIKFEEIEMQ